MSSYVLIAPLTDAQQLLLAARGVFSRHDPHPGRQISPFSKGACVAYRSDQGRRRYRTDSWDLRESLAGLILLRHFLDDRIHWFNARCQLLQFQFELSQQNTEGVGQIQLSVFQDTRELLIQMTAALGHSQPAFQKKAANLVHYCGTSHHPTFAYPM